MAMALRRFSIWMVVLAVALASAWVGFQLAQGQTVADIGRTIGIDTTGHKGGHQPPQGCYGSKGKAPAKNPNC